MRKLPVPDDEDPAWEECTPNTPGAKPAVIAQF